MHHHSTPSNQYHSHVEDRQTMNDNKLIKHEKSPLYIYTYI